MAGRISPETMVAVNELFSQGQERIGREVCQLRDDYPSPLLSQRITGIILNLLFPRLKSNRYDYALTMIGAYGMAIARKETRGINNLGHMRRQRNRFLACLPRDLQEEGLSAYENGYVEGVHLEAVVLLQDRNR
ncbi:MAG: hypothetical protein PHE48_04000 [Candidatus Daviesbacteria bacterium]|nr:hypothetical protein [Candidatus Daviesbacteria bacterium]